MHASFGTDGVRGTANVAVTAELALALGRAATRVFGAEVVVVGRDTRISGPMLEAAVCAGACAEGAEATAIGVAPTPAVAHACAEPLDGRVTAGVMISASHNPFADNGLKIFGPGGRKLTDAQQGRVAAELATLLDGEAHAGPADAAVGATVPPAGQVDGYAEFVQASIEGRSLGGIRVVLDCANGANWKIGPRVLRALGAEVEVIGAHPDGVNINDGCGSNHPHGLASAVTGRSADIGIAFDGDADRVVAVDHLGRVADGDQLMAILAGDMRSRGLLAGDTVVVTVMSNLGFRRAMDAAGITVVDTSVGDRYVLEALEEGGFSLGGEQSGHLVFRDITTTGDGLLSAVLLLDLIARTGRPLADLVDGAMQRLPQVLVNVPIESPMKDVAQRLSAEIAAVESDLGDAGRVLLRPSGTEPVVRVMAEADTEQLASAAAQTLVEAVRGLSSA
ncbi:MAG: phosphoglucosamine mutase [Actinomycetia bacterium]|nr:phosphoglucosamine mutase [Actinomycetes bacterium]